MIQINSISFTDDIGQKFENLVFLHLRRKYSEIFYFSENKECDFIVFENGKPIELVQVCYMLNNDNFERETSGLFEAMDFFKLPFGTIVTLNQNDNFVEKNKTINVIEAHKYFTK